MSTTLTFDCEPAPGFDTSLRKFTPPKGKYALTVTAPAGVESIAVPLVRADGSEEVLLLSPGNPHMIECDGFLTLGPLPPEEANDA